MIFCTLESVHKICGATFKNFRSRHRKKEYERSRVSMNNETGIRSIQGWSKKGTIIFNQSKGTNNGQRSGPFESTVRHPGMFAEESSKTEVFLGEYSSCAWTTRHVVCCESYTPSVRSRADLIQGPSLLRVKTLSAFGSQKDAS